MFCKLNVMKISNIDSETLPRNDFVMYPSFSQENSEGPRVVTRYVTDSIRFHAKEVWDDVLSKPVMFDTRGTNLEI